MATAARVVKASLVSAGNSMSFFPVAAAPAVPAPAPAAAPIAAPLPPPASAPIIAPPAAPPPVQLSGCGQAPGSLHAADRQFHFGTFGNHHCAARHHIMRDRS